MQPSKQISKALYTNDYGSIIYTLEQYTPSHKMMVVESKDIQAFRRRDALDHLLLVAGFAEDFEQQKIAFMGLPVTGLSENVRDIVRNMLTEKGYSPLGSPASFMQAVNYVNF